MKHVTQNVELFIVKEGGKLRIVTERRSRVVKTLAPYSGGPVLKSRPETCYPK
jgi:hypothetical protein